MYVAFDDTDSVDGMCTTFLAAEVIKRTGLDLIGYPRLVRLNPNIGYKTRGNGAVVIHLGKGAGKKFRAGEFEGETIFGFEGELPTDMQESSIGMVSEIVEEYAELQDEKTNPGIVVSKGVLSEDFYYAALRREVSPGQTEKDIRRLGLEYRKFKNGRGIVGSTAALGWKGRRKTYEILAYDYPRPKKFEKELQMEVATFVENRYTETFNNVDFLNRHAAIFPSNRTPVVYGIRATDSLRLFEASEEISRNFEVGGTRKLIFETNQGTDDHLVYSPASLWDSGSFALRGEITEVPAPIRGGHYFTGMKYGASLVKLAAFEPTKEFRSFFRELRPGDLVEAMGAYSEGTLNVEKMRLMSVSRYFRRVPPVCGSCGAGMKTHGKNDFRCRICGSKSATPGYVEEQRGIAPGNYEVPVSARRHLSMPFKLEAHFLSPERCMARGDPA